jgi:uncharacterized protein (DUF58 family)
MERENRGRVAVLLATSLVTVPPSERRTALESAVSLTASLVRHFHRERRPVTFGAPGVVRRLGSASESFHHCLEHLATIRSDPSAGPQELLEQVGDRALRGMDVILVHPGSGKPSGGSGYRLHPVGAMSGAARRLLRRGW